jgi:catechol 2,3-dioxygenase-like lactoylglutathione lyase family enzyme
MRIADACLIIDDVDVMSAFYADDVGLRPRMRNESFADFEFARGPRLAMWESAHIAATVGERLGAPDNRFTRTFRASTGDFVGELARRLADRLVAGPAPTRENRRRATFRDPEGFVFHVEHDPARSATEPEDRLLVEMTDIEVRVRDVERSAAFYSTIGFAETARQGGVVRFDGGEVSLTVTGGSAATEPPPGTFTAAGRRLMGAIELDGREAVDVLYARLLADGVEFSSAPQRWPWGAWATSFADPDGVLWEIYAWVGDPYTW